MFLLCLCNMTENQKMFLCFLLFCIIVSLKLARYFLLHDSSKKDKVNDK